MWYVVSILWCLGAYMCDVCDVYSRRFAKGVYARTGHLVHWVCVWVGGLGFRGCVWIHSGCMYAAHVCARVSGQFV